MAHRMQYPTLFIVLFSAARQHQLAALCVTHGKQMEQMTSPPQREDIWVKSSCATICGTVDPNSLADPKLETSCHALVINYTRSVFAIHVVSGLVLCKGSTGAAARSCGLTVSRMRADAGWPGIRYVQRG